MAFPLGKMNCYDLISVLNKMDYDSLINCRLTAPWLNDFIDENRKHIKPEIHVCWVSFRSKVACLDVFEKEIVPDEELVSLRPKIIQFQETSKEQILSLHLKRFLGLKEISVSDLEEQALYGLLDKLDRENVPPAICIYRSSEEEPYNDSLTKHPIFQKVKKITMAATIREPDLSFLCADHDVVEFTAQRISSVPTFVKAIRTIIDGSNSTRQIEIHMEGDQFACEKIIENLEMVLVWSEEIHARSHFKERNIEALPTSFAFWSIPMANGKVFALRVRNSFDYLLFKVFDSEQKFLRRITQGHLFEKI